MRRIRLHSVVCSLLALTLLGATSQYLAHFHLPRVAAALAVQLDVSADHATSEHCTLCLQFDRLPAPPTPVSMPVASIFAITVAKATAPGRLSLDAPHLWPPARAPPSLTC